MENLFYASKKLILIGSLLLFFSCSDEPLNNDSLKTSKSLTGKKAFGLAHNDMVMYWNDKAATVLSVGMPQPYRTRRFAIIQIAVHDALNSIKPKYDRFALLNELEPSASPDAAVASAAYHAIIGLNLQSAVVPLSTIDDWYKECMAKIPPGNESAEGKSKKRGIDLGKAAAAAIIANRLNDGFTQITPNLTSITPSNGVNPGEYRSTLMAANWIPQPTLATVRFLPTWGTLMKPYVIENNQQFRPLSGPYAVNSNEYTTDFNEVKIKGARVNGIRSADEEKIGKFWSENRPSIIWNVFVRKAIENKKLDAWRTARLFALMHVSMAESVNSVLNASYHFYYWRPETAIRLAATDGNNNTESNPDWLPILSETPTSVTPSVPSYPSSFTAFGGSTAEVLRLFFGSDETSIDIKTTSTNPYVPADPAQKPSFKYSSFSEAARDNSLSVIYNGWDFRKSALDGEEMGRQIANYVFNNSFRENDE